MSVFWRVRLFILAVVVFILACFGVYWGLLYLIHGNAAAPFKPHMAEYLAPTKETKTGAVRGQIVVVDRGKQDVDWDVFFDLPNDLRAAKPEDVGTVAWLEYGRQKERGGYGKEGYPAYRQTCTVTVIDQASRDVIGTTEVKGGDPPNSIDEGAKEGVGSKPTKEVVDYLKSLPRQ